VWVVLVSLSASCCFAAAVVLQQHAAVSHGANLGLILRPLWIAGIAIDFVGFLLQLLALHLGGIVEVQVLLTSVLAFGLLFAGAKPGSAGWWGIGLLTAGLAGALLAANPRPPASGHDRASLWLPTIVIFVAATALALTKSPVLQAVGGAMLFALSALLGQRVGNELEGHEWWSILTKPWVYLLVVASLIGLAVVQRCYERGRLAPTLVVLTLVDPIASLVLGIAVGRNHVRGGDFLVLTALAGIVMVVGIVLLARVKGSLATRREAAPVGT
jgi:hypothetical protein